MKEWFRGHKVIRVFVIILVVLGCLALGAILFLKLWPAFGGRASTEEQQDYAKRATNYEDGKFYNDGEFEIMRQGKEEDEQILSKKGVTPEEDLPVKASSFDEKPAEDDVQITWFGHSSMLIQMHGMNLLIDPVFSERSSPVSFVGSQRFSHAQIAVADLPEIDVVLFSHDHYDHLDYSTIKELDSKVKRYVVPLGVENHLERWDVSAEKIQNMAWWEEINVDGLTIACTPSRHYSGRSLDDQFATLWASWVLKDEYHQIFESGDSGYGSHFQKIHDEYGDFDFVLIDCAQYDVNWPEVHMFPEESIQAVKTLGANITMPIHWGAFALANHAWDDPAERFTKAGVENGLQVATPMIGETMQLSKVEEYQSRWWQEQK